MPPDRVSGLSRLLRRVRNPLIAIIITFGLTSDPAQANEACSLARHLVHIETLSVRITATGNTAAAQQVIAELMAEINAVPPGSGRFFSDELSTYELAAFMESRVQMARIFAKHGLVATQSHINKPSYRNLAQGVRNLESLLDCANRGGTAHAQGDGAANGSGSGSGASSGRSAVSELPLSLSGVTRAVGDIDARLPLLGGIGLAIAFSVFLFRRRMLQRDGNRYPCDLETELRLGSDFLPARIVDISSSGAKLKCNHTLAQKLNGTLSLGQEGWFGVKVIWSNESYTGVAFRSRLSFDITSLIAESNAAKSAGKTKISR